MSWHYYEHSIYQYTTYRLVTCDGPTGTTELVVPNDAGLLEIAEAKIQLHRRVGCNCEQDDCSYCADAAIDLDNCQAILDGQSLEVNQ